jgi:cysteine/glycine-rich protein
MEGPAGAANFEGTLFCKSCFQKGGYHQKQRNVVWTPSEAAGSAGPSKFGGGGQKCTVCEKTVYAAETVAYEKKPYHSDCFKCSNCTKRMTPSGAAIFEEKLFCTKCFDQGGYRTKQAATASKVQAVGSAGASSGPSKFGGGGNKCVKCDKTVYAAETVSFEKAAYHADCFRCDICTKLMNASGAAVYESQLLCTKCFKDGGYERKQANTARDYKPSASAAPSKFGGGGAKCYSCGTTVYAAETLSYEKKPFHGDCFKCKNCSKKLQPSGAEAKHTGDDIEVYCKKCWGDLGLNRAQLNKKDDAASSAPAADSYAAPAAAEPAAEEHSSDAPAADAAAEEPAAAE